MTGQITTDITGPVARVTLDNPSRRNAMTIAMWQALRTTFTDLAADKGLRAVIVAGAGETFCAGADVSEFAAHRRSADQAEAYSRLSQAATDAILALPLPVIAEVRGPCLGAGTAIALACDLRYLDAGATWGIPAARLGVGYELNWLSRMVTQLGAAVAAEALLTAASFGAEQARETGFAHAVLDSAGLAEHVAATAHTITRLAPLTLAAAKAGVAAAATGRGARLAAARVRECGESADYQRALAALAARERPEFCGD